MKIAAHITFFYVKERLPYLTKSVVSLSELDADVHVYIYTNKYFRINVPGVKIIYCRFPYLKNFRWQFKFDHFFNQIGLKFMIHPFFLSWENRKNIKKLFDKYQYQMYLEDDIEFTQDNFNYFLKHKDKLYLNGYNVGFLRIEHDKNNEFWYTDLWEKPSKIIEIDGSFFLENTTNPYHAFWIYDNERLLDFMKTTEWNFEFNNYNIREKSAIGLHGKGMNYFKGSLIPLDLIDNKLIVNKGAHVHHLPNNYIGHHTFCTQRFPLKYNT